MGRRGTHRKRGTYADGRLFDAVHYLQSKLLLKPDRFTSLESFREFGKLVKRTAKSVKVDFSEDENASRPRVREIVFGDTPDFRLYNNGFILRRRISYVDGFPVGDPEIVFKFRYPDEQKAAAFDVRPKISGKYRVKFKMQTLPLKEHLGGYRVLYSHNCQFGVSQVHEGDRLAMSTLARVFPALAVLKKSDDERIRFVNEGVVEELLLPLGHLDFGKGVVAKSDVALWRTRGDHMPVVGEFAFQIKFGRRADVPNKARERTKRFFVRLQYDVKDWIALGTTKTGMVYRLKGKSPESHE